ncbi:hypothetical protein LCGC14_3160750, partial [marine sediment metagenome]
DGTDCSNRRSQVQDTKFTVDTDLAVAIIPNNAERWISMSVFLDANFPVLNQSSGFMALMGLKGAGSVGSAGYVGPIQGWLGLTLDDSGFAFRDTWISDAVGDTNTDFWRQFSYSQDGCNWSGGNIHWTPNQAAATALLGDLNKGGWTDFIFHFRTDTRDLADQEANNNGFYDIYMRHNSNARKQVLAIRPQNNVDFGGTAPREYNKGIGVDGAYYTNWAIGCYCSTNRVLSAPNNLVLYWDNLKVGDENVSFSQMTPDGTTL